MRAVVKYEVRKELEPIDPMYGRSKLIGEYDDLDAAVKKAKEAAKFMAYVGVEAVVYANQKNYEKKFRYDTCSVWPGFVDDETQAKHAKAWVARTVKLFE